MPPSIRVHACMPSSPNAKQTIQHCMRVHSSRPLAHLPQHIQHSRVVLRHNQVLKLCREGRQAGATGGQEVGTQAGNKRALKKVRHEADSQ